MKSETITYLEMRSPEQLVAAGAAAEPITLVHVGPAEAGLVRSLYNRIGAPLGWVGRAHWSDRVWEAELRDPAITTRVASVGQTALGFFELEMASPGEVGIVVIGIVPELIGRGFGGELLTQATRIAWELIGPVEERRVWVQTSSNDHPHALLNYVARGFQVYRSETRVS